MWCPNCGSELRDDVTYCTFCGAALRVKADASPSTASSAESDAWSATLVDPIATIPTPSAAPSPQTSPVVQVESPSLATRLRPLLIPGIIAVVALAIVGAVIAVRHTSSDDTAAPTEVVQPTDTQTNPSSEADSAEPSAPSLDQSTRAEDSVVVQPVTFSSSCITVTMPGEYVAQGYTWVNSEQGMLLSSGSTQTPIAWIAWDERAGMDEVQEEKYDLGRISDNGATSAAILCIPYVNAEGMRLHWNDPTPAEGLACEHFLGVSAEELLSWIEVTSPAPMESTPAQEPTTSEPSMEEPAPAYGLGDLSNRTSAFYGVWAFASKDLAEAVSFASDARANGFSSEVFLTTDWENLNSEPWYVVSLGCFGTELEAEGLRQRAAYVGYSDAYVKWSGSYQG